MKKLYIIAWFAFAAAFLVSAFTASLDAAAVLVFSLIALALVYSLALWSVLVDPRGIEPGRMSTMTGPLGKEVRLQ